MAKREKFIAEATMKSQPDLDTVNKWVTDKRMNKLIALAESVLKTPIKGLTIDTSLQPSDADIIGLILLSQIQDETKNRLIFTEATKVALQDAAKIWFLDYLKNQKEG